MQAIRLGSRGAAVRRWQFFLLGQGFYDGKVDGDFGPKTHQATVAFQAKYGLAADGIVGNRSYGQAMLLGFGAVRNDDSGKDGPNYPAAPAFSPLTSNRDRQALFGYYDFVPAPRQGDPDAIQVLGDWETQYIQWVNVPQLAGFRNAKRNGDIQFHRLAAPQLVKLWKAWEDADLLDRILSFEGSYVPRFVRGSRTNLSNHAFGSAFDINMRWNRLGAVPALLREQGCVRELVEIANEHGFYWGGHFRDRPDGMHFEVAFITE
jgi:hypothetical protein